MAALSRSMRNLMLPASKISSSHLQRRVEALVRNLLFVEQPTKRKRTRNIFTAIQRKNRLLPVFSVQCAGEDSNLRRPKPADLQSALVDHLSTDACRKTSLKYNKISPEAKHSGHS